MKYVKTFESYKEKRNEPVNEELFGGILNFFKNMWNTAVNDIKKLGEKPTMEQLATWIEQNSFNKNSKNYIFKSVMDEFKKNPTADDNTCLSLIENLIDPDEPKSALGKQALSPLYDSLMKVFGKNLAQLNTIKFYFGNARNRAIKDYKYAGGPDADPKTLYPKVDPAKKILDLKNTTHLPDLKALLSTNTDTAKKRDVTIKWVEGTLVPRLLKYVQEVTKEQVDAYNKIAGVETESTTTKESVELFWVDKNIEFAPDSENKGSYKISKSNSNKILVNDLVKISGDIKKGGKAKLNDVIRGGQRVPEFEAGPYETGELSKIMVGGVEVETHTFKGEGEKSPEHEDLAKKLGDIKEDPEKLKTISGVVDALDDETKREAINKIVSETPAAGTT